MIEMLSIKDTSAKYGFLHISCGFGFCLGKSKACGSDGGKCSSTAAIWKNSFQKVMSTNLSPMKRKAVSSR